MAPSSLSVFVLQIATILLLWCVCVSARIVNPHRFHNLIFHPKEMMTKHRTRRDDDCQSDDWESMTFAGRVANGDSDAIIQGTVRRLINAHNPFRPYQGRGVYTAEVEIDCLYRGWDYGEVVNISGFGETPDCVQTHVALGKSYIFLIQTDWYGNAVHEYNDQKGAVEVTPRTENEVRSLYRCRSLSETSSSDADSYMYSIDQPSSRDMSYSFEISSFDTLSNPYDSICPTFFFSSSIPITWYFDYYDYDNDGFIDKLCNGSNVIFLNHLLLAALMMVAIFFFPFLWTWSTQATDRHWILYTVLCIYL